MTGLSSGSRGKDAATTRGVAQGRKRGEPHPPTPMPSSDATSFFLSSAPWAPASALQLTQEPRGCSLKGSLPPPYPPAPPHTDEEGEGIDLRAQGLRVARGLSTLAFEAGTDPGFINMCEQMTDRWGRKAQGPMSLIVLKSEHLV